MKILLSTANLTNKLATNSTFILVAPHETAHNVHSSYRMCGSHLALNYTYVHSSYRMCGSHLALNYFYLCTFQLQDV